MFKADKDDHHNNIYKIGGHGNGDIKFTVVPKPYQPSGQPLPAVIFTALIGASALGTIYFKLRRKHK